MKPGDKVWRGEYGRVEKVTIIAIHAGQACLTCSRFTDIFTCPLEHLFTTKTAATAHTAAERIKALRRHYETIERDHESFRAMAKSVLEALEAHDQP